ncbi:hypothetical protein K6V98_00140 [Collinsella sp. AGMB00827]|uniref:Uncharacterized protein n=1 Tax=Collinsella ureilytica TaxID=2869515 RepID=A0ABS7MHE4_9ACTN|nr:hypothetical protein [Collinsella urealyticum]MBY4796779.1 hypothetical protein [Collinsella urealyticum]
MDRATWSERSSSTTYKYVRVSRATGEEVAVLPMLAAGSITRNNDVRIIETAEAACTAPFDIGSDLVRIYLETAWPAGNTASVALGTFTAASPSRRVTGAYSVAAVKFQGRLQELLSDRFTSPVSVPANTPAVERAKQVCEEAGLVVIADASDYKISRARTYGVGVRKESGEIGDTKLDMVNDLLSLAGFSGARTDAMGRVVFRRYTPLVKRPVAWEFREGPSAKFERHLTEERDAMDVANRVVVCYSTEKETVIGVASDEDPASEFSKPAVGRWITKSYTYSDLPAGATPEKRKEAANERAAQLLKQGQSIIERLNIRHAFAPIGVGDAVEFSYPTAGIAGKFEVRTQRLLLKAGCPTETELRRFVR